MSEQIITTLRLNKEVCTAFKKFCVERDVKFGITLETAMLHLIAGRVHSEGAGKYEGEMRERNRILNIVKNVKHQRFRKVNMALDRIIEDVDKPSHPKGKLDGIHGERLVDNDK